MKPLLVLALCACGVAVVETQSPATLSGTVIDQTGAVLPGVTVQVVSSSREQTVVTDDAGEYLVESLPAGEVELTFRLLNFSVQHRSATLKAGRPARMNVTLSLSLQADLLVTETSTFRHIADIDNPAGMLAGIASAASQGVITWRQLEGRPIMHPGEVLDSVPMRGFNLHRGTDFATTIAGVPVHTPSGAYSDGYAGLGFVIPELVSGVQFRKGPYYADEGDFSAVGAARINYVDRLESPIARVGAGSHGWARALAAASPRIRGGRMLTALELQRHDGPWQPTDQYEKLNSVVRYSYGDNRNGFTITGMNLWSNSNATGRRPERAVASGLVSVDATTSGQFKRHSMAAEVQRSHGPSAWRASGYVLRSAFNWSSNSTYLLDDPDNGDQFEQAQRRTTAGGRVTYRRLGALRRKLTQSSAGAQVRRDWLSPVGRYRTEARKGLATKREDHVAQTVLGLYVDTEVEWTRTWRTTLGVRSDVYHFDVTARTAGHSSGGSAVNVSPKFAAVVGPWNGTELYVDAGRGFHGNDARRVATRIARGTPGAVDAVTPLERATGAEVGLRTVRFRGLQSSVAWWYLALDSEWRLAGDDGTTDAGRPRRRHGIEWANYIRLRPWLTADFDVSFSRASVRDTDPAGNAIPGRLERVLTGGLTVERWRVLSGSLRLRHLGPRPLIENRSVMSKSTTGWNAEGAYRVSPKVWVVLALHTQPALPRAARVALHVTF